MNSMFSVELFFSFFFFFTDTEKIDLNFYKMLQI